ncbi:MAG TPA: hypothetical protein VM491_22080, partial [Burkholderiaceae bacterium]|nr:hypothetical protein [Burkholderiaceae bacterium]
MPKSVPAGAAAPAQHDAAADRFGSRILQRADALAAITEDPPRVTRRYLTDEHRRAGTLISQWMREAGMD